MYDDDYRDELYDDEFDEDDLDEGYDDDSIELVSCPECGAEIYEEAEQCPVCGAYVTFRSAPLANWPPVLLWLALVGCIAVTLVLIFGF